WPALNISRVPVTDAVAARPPRPQHVRRSLVASLIALAAGIAAIAYGIDPKADTVKAWLFIPGIVAVTAAGLFAAAPILRALARGSGRAPVGVRLAVRDLARFEARSAAALGAISLSLGIAVSVVVISAANVAHADQGNLAASQGVVWTSLHG